MPGSGYLLAGASLCGGRAYALLEQFFRSTASMLGTGTNSCYDVMARLLDENPRPDDVPADTRCTFDAARRPCRPSRRKSGVKA